MLLLCKICLSYKLNRRYNFCCLCRQLSLIDFLTWGQYEKLSTNASHSVYLQGPFVAGFSSSNLGDSSPNILGPVCVNTGEKCDYLNSSCPIGGVSYYYKHAVYLGLQKVGKFPVNFGNFPEISETYREFWKLSGIFGNLPGFFGKFPEIYRTFSTPLQPYVYYMLEFLFFWSHSIY